MAFKLNPKTKDIFDIIRAVSSFITIFLASFALFFSYAISSITVDSIPFYVLVICKIVAVILVLFPFVLYFKDRIILRYIIITRKLSGYIIEKQEVTIDITTQSGDKANIYQKIFFHKFNNKTKNPYLTKIDVGGKILADSIQTINCYYKLNFDQNSLEVSYVNKMEKLNKAGNFFKENDKFLILYATLLNTFDNSREEFWDMNVQNLCQDYSIEIIIPSPKRFEAARFYKLNGNIEEIVNDIQPLIIEDNGRQKITLRIMNFDNSEKYRIKWSLN